MTPLHRPFEGLFGIPPFGAVAPEQFGPAFDAAFHQHRDEIAAIKADRSAPDFDGVIGALEASGRALAQVSALFHALVGAHSNDALLAIEREIAPRLAAHWDALHMDQVLFGRIETLFEQRANLGDEQARVLERYRTLFRRAGAGLDAAARERLAAIGERLAELGANFGQNVLADEKAYAFVLDEADLGGLPDHVRIAAREAATERSMEGKSVVTLSRSSAEPFLQYSNRRDLREKVFQAFVSRGDQGGATDNKAIIAEMIRLRLEKAKLLGYRHFADYRLEDAMAKNPQAVRALLERVWKPAATRARADRDDMQAIAQREGGNFRLAAWDWRYYAEKLRKERCDLNESEIEPYLALDNMIEAAFETARRLFGLSFTPLPDAPTWHPDVRVWEVRDRNGAHLGVFFGDYFARPSKRGGAWMTTLRDQEKLAGDIRPLVLNVMNFTKAPARQASLLSFDDARTLFHEFGHALHALLSDVTYPMIAGTNVATDFVELPSQLYEHWLETPDILRRYAVHHRTGAPMPDELLRKLLAARTFNQAFKTIEYVACALVDLEAHSLENVDGFDAAAFEAATLAQIGMPDAIAMRHRSPHFLHVFSGDHYASGYYSYMWSEVLDADAFKAFEESGNAFDPSVAERLRLEIYSAGGRRMPDEAYIAFRGRLPSPDALLRKRGFEQSANELSAVVPEAAKRLSGIHNPGRN